MQWGNICGPDNARCLMLPVKVSYIILNIVSDVIIIYINSVFSASEYCYSGSVLWCVSNRDMRLHPYLNVFFFLKLFFTFIYALVQSLNVDLILIKNCRFQTKIFIPCQCKVMGSIPSECMNWLKNVFLQCFG